MPPLQPTSRYMAAILACTVISSLAVAQGGSARLQTAITRTMSGHRGTAVVMEVASGRVVAAYNLDFAARRAAYPGSSIKPFTLMALLEAGKVDSSTSLMCKRTLTIGGHKLDCSHPATGQPLDAATALAYSCNSYFTTVAARISPAELRTALLHDGFDAPTGTVANESAGAVVQARTPEELQLEAIGEWGVKVTPLELLFGYRRLALMQKSRDPKFAPVFDGLEGSVEYGMGRAAQPASPMKVAGKTGTAESEDGPWTHAWFAGYAPAQNPQIALVVFFERGRGGADAAVVARQIFAAFAASQVPSAMSPSKEAR